MKKINKLIEEMREIIEGLDEETNDQGLNWANDRVLELDDLLCSLEYKINKKVIEMCGDND